MFASDAQAAPTTPQWIAPPLVAQNRPRVRFTSVLSLPSRPDRTLVRVRAQDRFRLHVGGKPVALGDSATPWVFDLSGALTTGRHRIDVDVQADSREAPVNAWVVLEKRVPQPIGAERLVVEVAASEADEWLYVEVLDAAGTSSGYYCAEKGRRDLMLGTDDGLRVLTLNLRSDERLALPSSGSCDFRQIARVRIRVDQKNTRLKPSGGVAFRSVRLEGGSSPTELGTRDGWALLEGSGDVRQSRLAPAPVGFRLAYDFRPAPDVRFAFDLRAFKGGKEIGRLVSGPGWTTEKGAPMSASRSSGPGGMLNEYWPADIRDIREIGARLITAMVDLNAEEGGDRVASGKPLKLRARVHALCPDRIRAMTVRVQDWSGNTVASIGGPLEWEGGEAAATVTIPALARGLYWITADTGASTRCHERGLAVVALGPGEKRVSDVFDTLGPFAPAMRGLQGVDLSYQDSPTLLMGLRRLGVNFLQFHLEPGQIDNGELDELIAFCRATRTRFALNNETANWSPSARAPDGRERFAAPNGCHRWDIEAPALRKAEASGLFEGVVYDEGEHMQLCRNYYSGLPEPVHRKPYLVETTGMSLPQAYEAFVESARGVATTNRARGARMLVESVFPVLWHPLARAGVTLCPKLLKEDIHPVVLAQALGAARQYGGDLWFSPDLWHMDQLPGHSVREYAAALRLAHSAGVDNVYTEFVTCLCLYRGANLDITPYGRTLQDHIRSGGPVQPRQYTFRDFAPEVAIVRFPDSDWGQASGGYWNTLYGAENLQSTEQTREWLVVWNHLTAGATSDRAVNANSGVYDRYQWRFTYPSPSVAVYDHLVGAETLKGARTIYLCGIAETARATDAVRKAVREGATCYAARRLCPPDVARASSARVRDGKGEWIVVEAFRPGMAWPAGAGQGKAMRLRFGHETIEIKEP